jgi:tetratricopeptide (TPR) repeat protein
VALVLMLGCAWGPRASPLPGGPLRLSELAAEGDAPRRASMRLVLGGLDADELLDSRRASSRYERAIQVDPTNPYAYLAVARQLVAAGESERALEYLDQVDVLLEAQASSLELSPRVEPHLVGLRGAALRVSGRHPEANALLARARSLAPTVGEDEQLSARELR